MLLCLRRQINTPITIVIAQSSMIKYHSGDRTATLPETSVTETRMYHQATTPPCQIKTVPDIIHYSTPGRRRTTRFQAPLPALPMALNSRLQTGLAINFGDLMDRSRRHTHTTTPRPSSGVGAALHPQGRRHVRRINHSDSEEGFYQTHTYTTTLAGPTQQAISQSITRASRFNETFAQMPPLPAPVHKHSRCDLCTKSTTHTHTPTHETRPAVW